jgi:hypothetical protein
VQKGIPLAGFAVTLVLLLAVRTFPGGCVVGGGAAKLVNRRRLWGGLVAAITGGVGKESDGANYEGISYMDWTSSSCSGRKREQWACAKVTRSPGPPLTQLERTLDAREQHQRSDWLC